MLVMIPIALFPLMLVLDVIALNAPDAAGVWRASFLLAAIAAVVTLVAIVPGIVDLAAIPDGTKAHRVALFHFGGGMLVLALYAASVYFRWPVGSTPTATAAILGVDALGTVAILGQGWLGAQLVYRHHVGVDAPAEGGDPVELKVGPGLHVPRPPVTRRREMR